MNKNSYILHSKSIKPKDLELVGKKAIEKSILAKNGFNTMPGFILSSLSFDDFLRSTNLVEPISLLLAEIKPFIKETAESVSEEIRALILKADIPKIIELPLIEAYKNLSPVLEDSFVSVQISNVIDEAFIQTDLKFKIENIKGIVQISDAIKEGWMTLFTPKALEFRVNEYYQGPLSIALLINKMASGDVSGEFVFTGETKGEIRAIYGIGNIVESEPIFDLYKVDTKDFVLTDKIINPQDKIKIRKGSSKNGKDILIDMEVSEEWRDKQKVPDVIINKILINCANLYKILKKPFKLNWAIESGEFYIEDYEVLKEKEKSYSSVVKEKKVKKKVEEEKFELRPVKELIVKDSVVDLEDEEDIERAVVLLNNSETILEDNLLDPKKNYEVEDISTVLDISSMSSSRIHAVQHFDQVYFDGSEKIFNSDVFNQFENPQKAIESIYVDILVAGRTAVSKGFIYSFSNLAYDNSALGNEDRFTGDERFIDNPKELIIEYIAYRRTVENLKIADSSFVLPSLRSYSNLKDLMKILESFPEYNLVNNKVYAEIGIPSFLFELTKLENEIDGFVIDYNKLLKLMVYRKKLRASDNKLMYEVMNEVKKVADHKNLDLFIKLESYKDEIIEEILKLGKVGIIFKSVPADSVFEKLQKGDKVRLNLKL